MDRVDEMTTPPVVGRFYLVPCVRLRLTGGGTSWWPTQGPPHEDADIGVPQVHYHHDPRFWTKAQLSGWLRPLPLVLGSVTEKAAILEGPAYMRRRCSGSMPIFPRERVQDLWLPALEQTHAAATLRGACKVCPHRGIPLASLPVAADGTVTCPGHGLRWDVSTGRLVRPAVTP